MKTVPYDLAGQTYYLCLNGTALFDCYDHFGPQGNLLDHNMAVSYHKQRCRYT